MDKRSFLIVFQKAVLWMNFRRLFLLFSTSLVVIFSIALYEGRILFDEIFHGEAIDSAPREPQLRLSQELQQMLSDTVSKSQYISGISVHTVNLKVNEQRVVFQYTDDPFISKSWEASTSPVSVMFDADQVSNLQMITIINGEFICSKFTNTKLNRSTPELAPQVSTVCQLSIPPFYGNFGGFITFYLKTAPTIDVQHAVRIDAVKASNAVYRELTQSRRANLR